MDALDQNPNEPPVEDLPPLREEIIPGTAYDALNVMHENVIENFRNASAPDIAFPSLWRLAKHISGERGPLIVYRFDEDPENQ